MPHRHSRRSWTQPKGAATAEGEQTEQKSLHDILSKVTAPSADKDNAKISKDDKDKQSGLEKLLTKTQLCIYHKQGNCRFGTSCTFAHNASEIRNAPDLSKTMLCKAFFHGKCSGRDSGCNYAHDYSELRSIGRKSAAVTRQAQKKRDVRSPQTQGYIPPPPGLDSSHPGPAHPPAGGGRASVPDSSHSWQMHEQQVQQQQLEQQLQLQLQQILSSSSHQQPPQQSSSCGSAPASAAVAMLLQYLQRAQPPPPGAMQPQQLSHASDNIGGSLLRALSESSRYTSENSQADFGNLTNVSTSVSMDIDSPTLGGYPRTVGSLPEWEAEEPHHGNADPWASLAGYHGNLDSLAGNPLLIRLAGLAAAQAHHGSADVFPLSLHSLVGDPQKIRLAELETKKVHHADPWSPLSLHSLVGDPPKFGSAGFEPKESYRGRADPWSLDMEPEQFGFTEFESADAHRGSPASWSGGLYNLFGEPQERSPAFEAHAGRRGNEDSATGQDSGQMPQVLPKFVQGLSYSF